MQTTLRFLSLHIIYYYCTVILSLHIIYYYCTVILYNIMNNYKSFLLNIMFLIIPVLKIRKSYRKLAKEWHPDRNQGNPDAQQKFQDIAEGQYIHT